MPTSQVVEEADDTLKSYSLHLVHSSHRILLPPNMRKCELEKEISLFTVQCQSYVPRERERNMTHTLFFLPSISKKDTDPFL